MAYDTDTLKEKALAAVDEHKLIYFKDVYAHLGISHNAFYDHFPKESEDYEDIKKAIQEAKINMKVSLRSKWYESNTASLQISLYKLLADKEELDRLSNAKELANDNTAINEIAKALTEHREKKTDEYTTPDK